VVTTEPETNISALFYLSTYSVIFPAICTALFYVLLTVHLSIILVNDQLDAQFFFYKYFFPFLYMFRANSCSSSGESIVSIQHLVCVTPCRWPSSMQVGKERSDPHTRRSPTRSDTCQMLYWYNWFSWWWARDCSEHVENWKKIYREKNCASSWSFTKIVLHYVRPADFGILLLVGRVF
jgi:hypothetical protein